MSNIFKHQGICPDCGKLTYMIHYVKQRELKYLCCETVYYYGNGTWEKLPETEEKNEQNN